MRRAVLLALCLTLTLGWVERWTRKFALWMCDRVVAAQTDEPQRPPHGGGGGGAW